MNELDLIKLVNEEAAKDLKRKLDNVQLPKQPQPPLKKRQTSKDDTVQNTSNDITLEDGVTVESNKPKPKSNNEIEELWKQKPVNNDSVPWKDEICEVKQITVDIICSWYDMNNRIVIDSNKNYWHLSQMGGIAELLEDTDERLSKKGRRRK